MSVRDIRTRISLDGEEKFKQALKEADREMRVMNSELKALAAEFDLSGNAQTYFTQKANVLGDEIKQQKQIIEGLEDAVKHTSENFDDGGRAAADYTIKLNNARTKLAQLEKKLEETNRESKEFGRDSQRVGRQIETGIGDAADDADEKLHKLIRTMDDDMKSVKMSVEISAITDVGGAIADIYEKAEAIVAETRETRLKRSQTLTGMQTQLDISEAEMNRLLLRIVQYTGDSQGAYETLQLLAQTGIDKGFMPKAIDILMDMFITYGEEARPEQLAESLQESTNTGELTGQLATLLGREKKDVEALSEAMAELTAGERANAIFTELGTSEAGGNAEKWLEENKALAEELKTVEEQAIAMAEIGARLSKVVTGTGTIVIGVVNDIIGVFDTIEKGLKTLSDSWFGEGAYDRYIGPMYDEWMAAIKKDGFWAATFGARKTGNAEEDQNWQEDWAGRSGYASYADMVAAEDAALKEAAEQAAQVYQEAFEQSVEDWVSPITFSDLTAANEEGGAEAVNALMDMYSLTDEQKAELIRRMQNAGVDMSGGFDKAMQTGMNSAVENAYIVGGNIPTAMANGIDEKAYLVSDAIDRLNRIANGTSIHYNGGGRPTGGGAGPAMPTVGEKSYVIMMDGEKVGQLTEAGVSRRQGREAARKARIM